MTDIHAAQRDTAALTGISSRAETDADAASDAAVPLKTDEMRLVPVNECLPDEPLPAGEDPMGERPFANFEEAVRLCMRSYPGHSGADAAEAHVRAGMCMAFQEDLPADRIVVGLAACFRDALTYLSPAERRRAVAEAHEKALAWLDEMEQDTWA